MITEPELLALMTSLESDRVERTISTTDTAKFREAICAFSNDFPNHRKSGFLLLGVHDKSGAASGLQATDELLRNMAGYRQDGEILPSRPWRSIRSRSRMAAGMSWWWKCIHRTFLRCNTAAGCGFGSVPARRSPMKARSESYPNAGSLHRRPSMPARAPTHPRSHGPLPLFVGQLKHAASQIYDAYRGCYGASQERPGSAAYSPP